VISLILSDVLVPCYDNRIMNGYSKVLERPKFGFSMSEVTSLLAWFESIGRSIVAEPCDSSFIDEADRKFYEAVKFITGDMKLFPKIHIY